VLEVRVGARIAGYARDDRRGRRAVDRFALNSPAPSIAVRRVGRAPQGCHRLDRGEEES
jgi:hypothetical protein